MLLLPTLMTIFATCGAVRGPHHPRGATVVKRHTHYTPSRYSDPQKLTHDDQLLHDTAHLEEHLEEIADPVDLSKMSLEELEFYYFRLHDSDNNEKLDGLEMLQAVMHTSHDESDELLEKRSRLDDLDFYAGLIDAVLTDDDTNGDGYLSYAEYKAGRKMDVLHNKTII